MIDLILLTLEGGEVIRCADLGVARAKAISLKETEGRIRLEVTPAGGGMKTVLNFDRSSLDWVAAT